MDFRIADTFTDSLARLTVDEQKAVKTTAFDLQLNPVNPGMSFHKLSTAKDKRFWSVRVSQDIRLIVHRTDDSLLLCYVDHHDKAYAWAERRSAASASWPTSMSWRARSSIHGSGGQSSCTRRSGRWSSAASAGRLASRARRVRAKRWSPSTARRTWLAPTPRRASF